MTTSSTYRRRAAAALGVLSVTPLVLFGVAVVGFALDWVHVFNHAFELDDSGAFVSDDFDGSGFALFASTAVAGAGLSTCLLVFYLVDAARNPALAGDRRVIW